MPSVAGAAGLAANDDYAGATAFSSLPFAAEADMTYATRKPTEPTYCSRGKTNPTVWFSFTAPASSEVLLQTWGTDGDSSIAVFTGSSEAELQRVTCDYQYDDYEDTLAFEAVAGTTYAIQVETSLAAHLVFSATRSSAIRGTVVDRAGTPVTNACVAAFDENENDIDWAWTYAGGSYEFADLPPGGSYRLRVSDCYGGDAVVPQWYSGKSSFETADVITTVAGQTSTADFTVSTAAVLTGIVRYDDGTPASHICLGISGGYYYTMGTSTDEDGRYRIVAPTDWPFTIRMGCGKPGYPWQYHDGARSHEDATFVTVTGGVDTETTLDLIMHGVPIPANDNFADAIALPLDATTTVEMQDMSVEPGEPTCSRYTDRSVWYTVTPDFTGGLELDTPSEASIGVYQGESLESVANIACFDGSIFSDDPEEIHVVDVTAGQTYYVQIGYEFWTGPQSKVSFHAGRPHGRTDVLFDAADTPCLNTCPFNTGLLVTGDAEYPMTDSAEAACAAEPTSLPGTWQDHPLTVPAAVDGVTPTVLRWEMYPKVDWDGYICRAEPDEYGFRYVAHGTLGGNQPECEEIGGTACAEDIRAFVRPGDELILRAYNWADTEPVATAYEFFG